MLVMKLKHFDINNCCYNIKNHIFNENNYHTHCNIGISKQSNIYTFLIM